MTTGHRGKADSTSSDVVTAMSAHPRSLLLHKHASWILWYVAGTWRPQQLASTPRAVTDRPLRGARLLDRLGRLSLEDVEEVEEESGRSVRSGLGEEGGAVMGEGAPLAGGEPPAVADEEDVSLSSSCKAKVDNRKEQE
mmetsp:Transcript_9280/g.26551  ORF Transcript_9280/g.26551 Transcript_9280/m.26551 type:complete len:139 (-) Transcript_9280:892-1308(-)